MNNLQKETIIKAGSAVDEQGKQRYLSDIGGFDDLPDNCHFNKVLTGCGGTTVALKNAIKYVIATPTKGIGKNKQKWADEHKSAICVIDGDSLDGDENTGKEARINKVTAYVRDGGKKIVVTYDSLPNVITALGSEVSQWKLLVDESHMLLEAGSFRYGAVYEVIRSLSKFKSYCLMTATPVRDDYQLDELKNIPKVSVEWENTEVVNIERRTAKKDIDDYAALLVLEYLSGKLGENNNAHIFLNSVTSIISIMRKVKRAYKGTSLAKQVKIVCASRSENKAKLKGYLGAEYKLGSTTEPASKVNFYTSTAFSGQDIFDERAVSYVVVDGRKDYSKVDITTTIPQIIGRVRNAEVKNRLIMMYSADEYKKYLDKDTYAEQVFSQLAKAKNKVNDYKLVSEDSKEVFINDAYTNEYLFYVKETDELVLNEIAQKSKLNAFDTQHATYRVAEGSENKSHTFKINSIDYNYTASPLPELEGVEKLVLAQKPDFKTLCLQHIEYKQNLAFSCLFNQVLPNAEEGDTLDIIQQSYDKLGPGLMKALGYREKSFREELIKRNKKITNHYKVKSMLGLKVADILTKEQAKEKIKNAYNDLGIKGNPTAKELENYYCIVYKKITDVKSGKRVDGIVIGAPKATGYKK